MRVQPVTRTKAMTELFGTTRNVVKGGMRCLRPTLLCPVTAGWRSRFASCSSLLRSAPVLPITHPMEREGQCAGNTGLNQYFVYVLEGAASIISRRGNIALKPQLRFTSLRPGCFK